MYYYFKILKINSLLLATNFLLQFKRFYDFALLINRTSSIDNHGHHGLPEHTQITIRPRAHQGN
jgi:hypothetical protein